MSKSLDMTCRPFMAWLTVNRVCNLRCVWCYGEDSGYSCSDDMSIELAKELVRVGMDTGVKHINIIGGEPTLWSGLFEFNDYCRSLGVTTGLITNGVRFSDDEFWDEYKKHPCDSMSVSVKSADQEQFLDVTKTNSFEKSMIGIERAVNFGNTGITTVYNSLVGVNGLKLIASKCRSFGAKYITIDLCTPVLSDGVVTEGFMVDMDQMVNDIMDLTPYLDNLYEGSADIGVYIPLCLFPADYIEQAIEKDQISTICHVYNRCGLNFDTNGDILPCNQLLDIVIAKYGIDYVDGESLLKHLNKEDICDNYRELLRYPSDECSKCRWKSKCRGGCLLNWMVYDPAICSAIQ